MSHTTVAIRQTAEASLLRCRHWDSSACSSRSGLGAPGSAAAQGRVGLSSRRHFHTPECPRSSRDGEIASGIESSFILDITTQLQISPAIRPESDNKRAIFR